MLLIEARLCASLPTFTTLPCAAMSGSNSRVSRKGAYAFAKLWALSPLGVGPTPITPALQVAAQQHPAEVRHGKSRLAGSAAAEQFVCQLRQCISSSAVIQEGMLLFPSRAHLLTSVCILLPRLSMVCAKARTEAASDRSSCKHSQLPGRPRPSSSALAAAHLDMHLYSAGKCGAGEEVVGRREDVRTACLPRRAAGFQ